MPRQLFSLLSCHRCNRPRGSETPERPLLPPEPLNREPRTVNREPPTPMNEHPNILILHSDQQRYDSLGCCGNPHAVTPNLDALAKAGTVFHRHIVSNPICMPSRASLFTGRYPNAHGVWHNGVPLPRASYVEHQPQCNQIARQLYGRDMICHVPTLADVLGQAGYQTRAVGKLHLTPFRATASHRLQEANSLWHDPKMADWHGPYYGFERVDLAVGHGEGTPGHYRHWLQRNFPDVVKALQKGEHRKALPFPQVGDLYASAITEEAHHSTWVGECVCEFLEKERDAQRPFFLFAGFPDPHHPFTPPAKLAEEFAKHAALPPHSDAREAATKPRGFADLIRGVNPGRSAMFAHQLPPEAIKLIRQYTDAMVHLIDRAVGRVLEALKRLNLWDNTIVIFTSDHGDFLGDHGLLRKETLCSQSLVHVPFLMRIPAAA
ncbi:MAG: hypothetical protein FJ279_10440, partial [Planctomycetes bacterium]|nr:hypothetical protein [Planctomycetota bacterium]